MVVLLSYAASLASNRFTFYAKLAASLMPKEQPLFRSQIRHGICHRNRLNKMKNIPAPHKLNLGS